MGVERSVTRWYLQRQLILDEITQLESKQALAVVEKDSVEPGDESEGKEGQEAVDVLLTTARKKLKGLGHCPKPMMG
ncbi:MAG: hypothetical protein H0U76_09595 [Ktedonobacteraceae bacterium]|nr:hypothetical protein [Ktedonobacteraceae bacterium]